MKKNLALSCAFLSVAIVGFGTGCGSPGSSRSDAGSPVSTSRSASDIITRDVTVVSDDKSKEIRVSWTNPIGASVTSTEVVQYQIYRAVAPASLPTVPPDVYESGDSISPSSNPHTALYGLNFQLVGVADGQTTTFTDTTDERYIDRQNLGEYSRLGTPYLPTKLYTSTQLVTGLQPGDYVYSVHAIYRFIYKDSSTNPSNAVPGTYYGDAVNVIRTNKIHFD